MRHLFGLNPLVKLFARQQTEPIADSRKLIPFLCACLAIFAAVVVTDVRSAPSPASASRASFRQSARVQFDPVDAVFDKAVRTRRESDESNAAGCESSPA
jgi:hypothetical protein